MIKKISLISISIIFCNSIFSSNEYYMYEEDSNDGMVFLWMWFIVAIYVFIGNITTNRKMGLSKEYRGVTIFLGILAVALGYLLLG